MPEFCTATTRTARQLAKRLWNASCDPATMAELRRDLKEVGWKHETDDVMCMLIDNALHALGEAEFGPGSCNFLQDRPDRRGVRTMTMPRFVYDGEGNRKPYDVYDDLVAKGIGGTFVATIAAPGSGRVVYKIVEITPAQVLLEEVSSTARVD